MERRNVIVDGVLYLNGSHMLAKVKEFEPPEIVQRMAECEDSGSLGKYKIPILKVDELSTKIVFNSFYASVFENFANPMAANILSLQYGVAEYENQAMTGLKTGRLIMRATAEKLKSLCDLKGQEPGDYPVELNCSMISHVFAGKEKYYIDIPNRIYRVNGIDLLAAVNAALGLT